MNACHLWLVGSPHQTTTVGHNTEVLVAGRKISQSSKASLSPSPSVAAVWTDDDDDARFPVR